MQLFFLLFFWIPQLKVRVREPSTTSLSISHWKHGTLSPELLAGAFFSRAAPALATFFELPGVWSFCAAAVLDCSAIVPCYGSEPTHKNRRIKVMGTKTVYFFAFCR